MNIHGDTTCVKDAISISTGVLNYSRKCDLFGDSILHVLIIAWYFKATGNVLKFYDNLPYNVIGYAELRKKYFSIPFQNICFVPAESTHLILRNLIAAVCYYMLLLETHT